MNGIAPHCSLLSMTSAQNGARQFRVLAPHNFPFKRTAKLEETLGFSEDSPQKTLCYVVEHYYSIS
jgi:hypothetical protein